MSSDGVAVIGLSSYREDASWGAWHQRCDLLPVAYTEGIRAAGGVAVLLPPGAPDVAGAATASLAVLDGLVLTGGSDVDPALYGQMPEDGTDAPRRDRDAWEIALVAAARAAERPVLAICRGLQVLNVALGGTLVQDLPSRLGNHAHRGELGTFVEHSITVAPATELAELYGTAFDVPVHHHQAVDRLADDLTAVAWASDGTIEAATCAGAGWITGVQWHPEVGTGASLFTAFMAACREASQARTPATSGIRP